MTARCGVALVAMLAASGCGYHEPTKPDVLRACYDFCVAGEVSDGRLKCTMTEDTVGYPYGKDFSCDCECVWSK